MSNMTKQQKAHDTKVFNLCRILAVAMVDLPSNFDPRDLVALWEQAQASKLVKGDAFHIMDSEPRRFARYQEWHPRLRAVRNTPWIGERLFDCWR